MKALLLGLLTGHGPLLPLFALASVGGLIFLVTARLARKADVIAEQTGLGRLWIGSVLLAAGTSLPEILTDFNAGLLDAPDIGVGDLLGSTLANMVILATLDLVFARRRILREAAMEHTLVGLLAILLTVMAGIAIFIGGWGRIGHVGVETLAIVALYLGAMWVLRPPRETAPAPVDDSRGHRSRSPLRRAMIGFAAGAAGLAVVTPLLVVSAEALSIESGLSEAFVGTLLVGLSTSFPETAATVAAIRFGAVDLAVGNIFGSNAFNMVVLLVMDVAYLRGPVLAAVSRDHLLTVLLATICLSLGIMAILARVWRRPGLVMVESVLIVCTYVVGVWLLSRRG